MACPKCECATTYEFNDTEFGMDECDIYRCAACGAIFPLEDEIPEERENETAEAAIQRAKKVYGSKNEFYIKSA